MARLKFKLFSKKSFFKRMNFSWKKIFHILCGIALTGFIFVLFAFVSSQRSEQICRSVKITINPVDEFFVGQDDIISMIGNEQNELNEKLIRTIKIRDMESLLNENPYINNAEVYADLYGNLLIDINQVEPVVRIINKDGKSFYMDFNGALFPVSKKFSSRVLVVTGNINFNLKSELKNNEQYDEIKKIALHIHKHDFWKAQIEQVFVEGSGEFTLIPRVGGHQILLGDCNDLDVKFRKLLAFYKEGLSKVGWDKYKLINLKYNDQIVCTKYY